MHSCFLSILVILVNLAISYSAFSENESNSKLKILIPEGEIANTSEYIAGARVREDKPIIEYEFLVPFQWPYSSNVAEKGGLIEFCESFHKDLLREHAAQDSDANTASLYWCKFTRYPDAEWEEYQRGNATKLPPPYPVDLYVYGDRVWNYYSLIYRHDPSLLATENSDSNSIVLRGKVATSSKEVFVGDSLNVTISLTNISQSIVFIPNFKCGPIQLVAYERETESLIEPKNMPEYFLMRETGFYLEPSGEFEISVDAVISRQSNGVFWPLNEGEYIVSIFNLEPFGYPTVCKTASFKVHSIGSSEVGREVKEGGVTKESSEKVPVP